MISDKQFEDSFTAAGGWFLLINFEIINNWRGTKEALIDELYKKGFDNKRTGTITRVSSALRIIENDRGKEALIKIKNSQRINSVHPEAEKIATVLLDKYY